MTSTITSDNPQVVFIDHSKGKQRAQSSAESTERTPLLASGQSSSLDDEEPTTGAPSRHSRLRRTLTFVFLFSLFFCTIVFVVLALIAYSYAARVSDVSSEDLLDRALVFKGPDRLDVLKVTTEGFWVQLEGRIGLDAGSAIGAKPDADDGFWQDIVKLVGRWGIRGLGQVSVRLGTINVSSAQDPSTRLLSVDLSDLELPLTAEPPEDEDDVSWLTKVSTPLLIRPTHDVTAFIHFVRQAWQDGYIAVLAETEHAVVRGGGLIGNGWRQQLAFERSHVEMAIHMNIPPLPGLPIPGRNSPFPPMSQLVTLQKFGISSGSDGLSLYAIATVIDPAPITFNFTSPPIQFIISLPAHHDFPAPPIPVASVFTEPFLLTHPNITIVMSGNVLPILTDAVPTLADFISGYLSGNANPIVISTPLVPGLEVDTLFPAPHPKPELLRNVTIRDMKIKATAGGTFLASGTVFAKLVLPKGVNVGLNVTRVLPDVLVFDGEVPDMIVVPSRGVTVSNRYSKEVPPAPPLPDPLPERAFGHIQTDKWLDATCVPEESEETESAAYAISAEIVDAVLQVLPGRQKEFRTFIGKVIFDSNGALAGILGSASVAVDVQGLPLHDGGRHEMELSRLPFQGIIRVGKKKI